MIWCDAGQWYAYDMRTGVLWAAPTKEECQNWLYGLTDEEKK